MEHVLAVGKVTDAAKELIEQEGGWVRTVSDVPHVTLVRLPDPTFCGVEYDRHSLLRVQFHAHSLIWQGNREHQRGPDYCSVETTMLRAEYGEPAEGMLQS
jgi:hypothetical protein